MKKLHIILICGLLCAANISAQQTWNCGASVTATLTGGTMTISGTGDMSNYNSPSGVPWYSVRESITELVFTGNVTSIGNRAFYGCTGLTSVVVPGSVTRLGLEIFSNCTNLVSIDLGGGFTSYASNIFDGCTSLTSIEVSGHSMYRSVDGVLFSGNSLFWYPIGRKGAYTIPDGTTSIQGSTFSNCSGITAVTIPASVNSIYTNAFYNCTGLISVTLLRETPINITSDVFTYAFIGGIRLIVPQGSEAAYQAADVWKDFYFDDRNTPPSGTCGVDLEWVYDMNGTLIISGTGDMYAYTTNYSSPPPWDQLRYKIQNIVLSSEVTSIGNNAFYGCVNVQSLTCRNPEPPAVTATSFGDVDVNTCILYVPQAALATYQETDIWQDFENKQATGNNSDLASLSASAVALNPNFSAAVTGYSGTVHGTVKSLVISATAADAHATVTGTGFKTLNVGVNTFPIVVTAHDGVTVKTYTLSVTREQPELYAITFDTQGGNALEPQIVEEGDLVVRPDNPVRSGYLFGGWFSDEACEIPWKFDTYVPDADVVLYAIWRPANVNTVFYVKHNGVSNGVSWATAAGNIMDMMEIAVAGDEIWVAEGTYTLPEGLTVKEGVSMFGGFAGNETSIAARTKYDRDGNGQTEPWEYTNQTILSGVAVTLGTSGESFLIETHFDGFTVTEGSKTGITAYGNVTVNHCLIRNISSRGIYNGVGATISNSGIANNRFSDVPSGSITGTYSYGIFIPLWYYARGGGIYNAGTILNCIVTNNTLRMVASSSGFYIGAQGGGIYNQGGTVVNCVVTNNRVETSGTTNTTVGGGGIYNNEGVVYCSTVLNNSTNNMTNNNALTYNCITDDSDMTQFINPAANDYRLKTGSTYIGAGSLDNLPEWLVNGTDLAGNPRVRDGIIDLGAYSYDAALVFYTVTFNSQGGSPVSSQPVEQGGKAAKPADPARDGYTFGGWYKEAACTNLWDFANDAITADVTLYAKWTQGGATTGVENIFAHDLNIYPNPFTGVIRVETGETGEMVLRVINAAGVVVHTQMITRPGETIRLEHLPTGVYLFMIENGKQAKTIKIIKIQ